MRSNGIVIRCEEDYDLTKVRLYKPPKCDKEKVARSIEQILRWNKPVDAGHLRIEDIAEKYMEFAERISKGSE